MDEWLERRLFSDRMTLDQKRKVAETYFEVRCLERGRITPAVAELLDELPAEAVAALIEAMRDDPA